MVISRPPLYQACIPPRTTKPQFSSRYSQPRPQVYRGFNGPPGWLRITPVVALAHPCSQSSLWCQNEPASSHTLDCRASSASICEHLCSQPCQLLFMKFELYSFVAPFVRFHGGGCRAAGCSTKMHHDDARGTGAWCHGCYLRVTTRASRLHSHENSCGGGRRDAAVGNGDGFTGTSCKGRRRRRCDQT